MPAVITRAARVFNFGDKVLQDPNPNMSQQEVLEHYSALYPELATAVIEKEEHIGKEIHFNVKKSAGTKG